MFAISIGLEREGQLVAGLVYNPISDEMFTAEKGKGAFLNDRRRLRVAGRRDIGEAVVVTGIPHRGRPEHRTFLNKLETVMQTVAGVRRTGSAALDLAWTAAGRFDAFWERNLKPWDIAAGAVLMREAGGLVTDFDGSDTFLDSGHVVAGNKAIHGALLPLVSDTAPAPKTRQRLTLGTGGKAPSRKSDPDA
jgi:myo-inositol-1(or 4)-monophosphatase